MNPTALAFIGDAVYEVFVRERILSAGEFHADALHKATVGYVRAEAQAKAARALIKAGEEAAAGAAAVREAAYREAAAPDEDGEAYRGFAPSPEELSLLKRARNHKIASKAKHASPIDYKLATAFEALAGYLYLSGQGERLGVLMEYAATLSEQEKRT